MKIPELQEVGFNPESGLHVGAATTIRTLEKSDIITKQYPLLVDTVKSFGSVQVRNMATLGGNICNASPGADFATPLLALGTQVKIVGPKGARTVTLDRFFTGPDQCVLESHELLTEFHIPAPKPRTGSAFIKIGRVAVDLSKVNAAAVLTTKDGVCEDVSIAMGATAPTPMRAKNAEATLKGQKITDKIIDVATQTASDESKPRTSLRSTAEYKRKAIKALVKRCLKLALNRGGN
jgi:carbon-monoxide dehydrogenase medium subunit